ncbi:MAG: RDD family protein [Epsilonproteobacteria bacterium]|nr:RDD family protein [Campylobacterota bacterium]
MRWRDAKKGEFKPKEKPKEIFIEASPIINRIKAFLTDSFMVFMPIIYVVFYVIMGSREEFRTHMLQGWIYILIPHYIITTTFLYIKNQTPGYRAYDLKLVTFKQKKPTLLQITVRYIIFTITLLVFPLLLMTFFLPNKLGLHDLISRTFAIPSK